MKFDNWKQQAPPSYTDDLVCKFCGEVVEDGEQFCNDNCRKGYKQDN